MVLKEEEKYQLCVRQLMQISLCTFALLQRPEPHTRILEGLSVFKMYLLAFYCVRCIQPRVQFRMHTQHLHVTLPSGYTSQETMIPRSRQTDKADIKNGFLLMLKLS